MKPVDINSGKYIDLNKENIKKIPVGDHVRILKYRNIFAKVYVPNWSEEVFVVKKEKNTVPSTYVIIDCNGEEIAGRFYEKEWQKNKSK